MVHRDQRPLNIQGRESRNVDESAIGRNTEVGYTRRFRNDSIEHRHRRTIHLQLVQIEGHGSKSPRNSVYDMT